MRYLLMIATCAMLSSCAQNARVHFKVIDAVTGKPVPAAQLEVVDSRPGLIGFTDLIWPWRPQSSYPKLPKATTDDLGCAFLKIPLNWNGHRWGQRERSDYRSGPGVVVTSSDGNSILHCNSSINGWQMIARRSDADEPEIVAIKSGAKRVITFNVDDEVWSKPEPLPAPLPPTFFRNISSN